MSFPRYPKYKDSGVEWLGEVPEHWGVGRLKHLAKDRVRNGIGAAADTDTEGFPRYVRITDINTARTLHPDTFRSLPPDVAAEAPFAVGDILFACVGATFGKSYLHAVDIGPVCYAGYLAKYSPNELANSAFISYWTESNTYWGQLNANVIQSTVQNFSAAKYNELLLAAPSVEEQAAIATFFDRETAKIDALIAEQQRLIELLQEKRQAVISHAVTKGLNPNAPMKDSGIEWLGEVPEHWSVVPLRRVMEVKDGTHATPNYVDASDNTFPLVTSKDFTDTTICFDEAKHISAEDYREIIRRSNTEQGDVLMSMIGGNIGKSVIVHDGRPFAIKNVALFKTTASRPLADFLLFYLQSGLLDVQIALLSRGGAQGFLGLSDIRNLLFFKVPPHELGEIASAIGVRVSRNAQLLEEAELAITLLQERRSALISAAVTGQIDVRGLAGSEAA